VECKYSLSLDKIYFKEIIRENEHKLYIKMSNRANQEIYRLIAQIIEQQQWVPVIANFYLSSRLQIINKL